MLSDVRQADGGGAAPAATARVVGRPNFGWEVVLVLGVSLGQSAVYSILSLLEKLTRPQQPIGQQTTSINTSVVPDRPWLDLAYQAAGIAFPLVPALIALYLLRLTGDRASIGFDLRRPRFDLSRGFAAAALIGVPGLGFYFLTRAMGLNTDVQPANLAAHWWTIPAYAGLAVMNGVLEEVVMLGFLFSRFAKLGWRPWHWVVASALIRGAYHLYQGFGGGVGNLVMGLVFGVAYLRWRRVGPLVAAHVLLDLVIFIGYPVAAPFLPTF